MRGLLVSSLSPGPQLVVILSFDNHKQRFLLCLFNRCEGVLPLALTRFLFVKHKKRAWYNLAQAVMWDKWFNRVNCCCLRSESLVAYSSITRCIFYPRSGHIYILLWSRMSKTIQLFSMIVTYHNKKLSNLSCENVLLILVRDKKYSTSSLHLHLLFNPSSEV